MDSELPFTGFSTQVREPLEHVDAQSFKRVKRLFQDLTAPHQVPYSVILKDLTGRKFQESEAMAHWRRILTHKLQMDEKLGRLMHITAAAVDYLCLLESEKPKRRVSASNERSMEKTAPIEEWVRRMHTPGYHMERLKDEMMRSRRYNHALSLIMLDLDRFHEIDQGTADEIRDAAFRVIAKIIRSTIRAVDIIARYSGDVFIIILPSTNKREAMELAERLRNRIFERTKQIEAFPGGVTATLSVGQYSKDDSTQTFIKQLETTLVRGKKSKPNSVYPI